MAKTIFEEMGGKFQFRSKVTDLFFLKTVS